MRDDRSRLRDIIRALDQIQTETRLTQEAFLQDPKLQVWALYYLQVIGEACRCLSDEFREQNPHPVWSQAVGLRNILVHHYFEIDADLIWQVVEHDLPPFRKVVEASLHALDKLESDP